MANANYEKLIKKCESEGLRLCLKHKYGSNGRGCVTGYLYSVRRGSDVLARSEYWANATVHSSNMACPSRARQGSGHDGTLADLLAQLD